MNIILTGYRATGKTTIGRALAKILKRKFIDTDDVIKEKEGMSIREIFEKHGWQYFRKIERKLMNELAKIDDRVIAVGGGTLMYKANLKITQNAKVILLIASIETLSERIKNDDNRPPLTKSQSSAEEIRTVWNKRKKRYYKVADIIIDTTDGNLERALTEIKKGLDQFGFAF